MFPYAFSFYISRMQKIYLNYYLKEIDDGNQNKAKDKESRPIQFLISAIISLSFPKSHHPSLPTFSSFPLSLSSFLSLFPSLSLFNA